MGNNQMKLGATESRDNSNRVYLNLRTGKLSQVSKEEKPGYTAYTTENASGQKYNFFAKTFDDLTVYIKDIVWHEAEFDGKKIFGWNLYLDAGDGKEYVLQIGSGDRPYQTLMQLLPNVDFAEPVRIVAFMGKDQKSGKNQKVLLLTQNPDQTAKDWIKAKYQPKWLSTMLVDKIKAKVPLTDEEKQNLAFTADGKIDGEFPYVRQTKEGKWSFDAWTDFLIDKMNEEVIPAVKDAQGVRDEHIDAPTHTGGDTDEWAGSLGDNDYSTNSDSEIPF